jgi:hypothetical protein
VIQDFQALIALKGNALLIVAVMENAWMASVFVIKTLQDNFVIGKSVKITVRTEDYATMEFVFVWNSMKVKDANWESVWIIAIQMESALMANVNAI